MMSYRYSFSRKVFVVFNYCLLTFLSLLCLAPLVHILAISFSSSSAAASGTVTFWPKSFTTAAYENVFGKPEYLRAFLVTLQRVALGTSLQLLLIVLTAYPLSRDNRVFKMRTVYVWFFLITILFSGGLIPTYMTVRMTGLMDTIWALVIPGAVPVFSIVLMLNFFRNLPKEIEESARIDGAGHLDVLWRIYVPLSTASIATVTLFSIVGHWNAWLDGLIYMKHPKHYPLQTFLQTIIIEQDPRYLTAEEAEKMALISNRTSRAAQIFVAALPILLVYPFLQRYFIHGIVLGSVKE
jgi:putative aldouronate transport system permease protein